MVSESVRTLIESLGELDPAQDAYAATALCLAAHIDSDRTKAYALPGLTRELRETIAAMTAEKRDPKRGVNSRELEALIKGFA